MNKNQKNEPKKKEEFGSEFEVSPSKKSNEVLNPNKQSKTNSNKNDSK